MEIYSPPLFSFVARDLGFIWAVRFSLSSCLASWVSSLLRGLDLVAPSLLPLLSSNRCCYIAVLLSSPLLIPKQHRL